jgi:hypothetical protein
MLIIVIVFVFTITGSLAISALALGRETIVGRAIAHAFRRMPSMLAASLLVAVVAVVILTAVALLLGIDMAELRAPTPATLRRFFLAILLFLIIALPLWVRLMMMTPVAAAETAGPLAIISRSWALTRGHFWKLLGFVLLLAIVVIVISVVVSAVGGILVTLAAGRPEPGGLSWLLMLLVNAVFNAALTVVFTTMVARIYAQLSGGTTSGS